MKVVDERIIDSIRELVEAGVIQYFTFSENKKVEIKFLDDLGNERQVDCSLEAVK